MSKRQTLNEFMAFWIGALVGGAASAMACTVLFARYARHLLGV